MTQQQGFSIVMAVFILIVFGLLGGYMVTLSGIQVATASYAFQGARAYQAARAGTEWAIAELTSTSSCSNINGQQLTFTGINGFTVNLTCVNSITYYESSTAYVVYTINSTSAYGSYNSNNYIARQIETTIILP